MSSDTKQSVTTSDIFQFHTKERSDSLMNFFLVSYFLLGLGFACFYGTWFIACSIGSLLLLAYYTTKWALPNSTLYQYVLSAVLGVFMAQFIYQMHGMFEMHFFSFIGSALLITYQKWKLQIPMFIVVMVHHATFGYLQNSGFNQIYFDPLNNFDLPTFTIHILLATSIFFICGLWAYQLKIYNAKYLSQTLQMAELHKKAQLLSQRKFHNEERSTILESIGDAFFAVDKNWVVTYWNNMAEKVLQKPKTEVLNCNLWDVYANSTDSESYRRYHEAINTNKIVHFEDYYPPLEKWYEISAYPSANGLSVYFKDVTERKKSEILLIQSEKKYSALFELSPLPQWVFDIKTLQFLDVNTAAIKHYGYSKAEFLLMTIKDIRPVEEVSNLDDTLLSSLTNHKLIHQGIFKHQKKNGDIIEVDIQSNTIFYKGVNAKVVLVNDVTERTRYVKAIEEQNKALKEISWMQSHIIRAPLARIMGLIPLIENFSDDREEREKMLEYMLLSVNELDEVIRNIVDKTIVN